MKVMKSSDMPQAFATAFNSGRLENLSALYEPQAKFVKSAEQDPEVKDLATGLDAINETLTGLLALGGQCECKGVFAIEFENLALTRNDWVIKTKNEKGEPLEIKGQSAEILRRQPDGAWLFVIDHPFGAITKS